MYYISCIISHVLYLMYYISCIISHVLYLMYYISCIISHVLYLMYWREKVGLRVVFVIVPLKNKDFSKEYIYIHTRTYVRALT